MFDRNDYRYGRLGLVFVGSWLISRALLAAGWIPGGGALALIVTGIALGLAWELWAAFHTG